MAQGKISNVKKAEVCVTDQDNSERFNSKLPTKNQGFCIIARTVYGIERKGNIYYGLIARRGRSPLKVSSFDLEKWDIDAPKPTKEQPVKVPGHPAQSPEDPKQNTCPVCKSGAVKIDDHFRCDSRFCQVRFIETGLGPELTPGAFKAGQVFEAYWMSGKHEMHASIAIISRTGDTMTVETNGKSTTSGVEVYRHDKAEFFCNPESPRAARYGGGAWIYPWNKRELRIKCNLLQKSALQAHAGTIGWPLRRSTGQIEAMASYPRSSVIGMLAASVMNDLRNDPHDEVVFA